MGALILSFELFLFFKLMQRLIELDGYLALHRQFPRMTWFFLAEPVADVLENRSRLFYRGLSWFFAMLLLLLVVMPSPGSESTDWREFFIGSVGMVLYFFYRANPYLQRIYKWSHE